MSESSERSLRAVELSAGTIRYRDEGSGPTLLFVHGFAVNGALWRGVIQRLAPRFRCVAPDWPLGGHSTPMRPDADLSPPALAALIAEFMVALGLDEVTLVGNDLGGALSQLVAARHPERLRALVLTPCDAFENFPPATFRYLTALPRIPGAPAVIARLLRVRPLRRLPLAYGWLSKRRLADEVIEGYVGPLTRDPRVLRDAGKVFSQVGPEHTLSALPGLAAFDRPVLLAWSVEDRFFPFEHAARLAVVFPNARVAPIADAWTLVAEDQPAALASAIEGFVTETASAAR